MMENLQSLWMEARQEVVEQWAEELLNGLGHVKVVVPPRPVLVMMQARDSVECECFCLGELLVTECQIAYKDQRFWGRVLGNRPARALALALLAAAEVMSTESLDMLEPSFCREQLLLDRRRFETAKALGTTMVRFETMST